MSSEADKIRARNLRALARSCTAIETHRPEVAVLLKELFPQTGRALILGITGPPGAGKSTLCDQLIRVLRAEGKTVAVVAIDPSSPFTGGAILGDRVRMQQHHADPGVFIRSMATRGWMGGLARAALETTLLLDAAGFDVVIVETVGAGQDEVDIARLAGVTLVVLTPGMGDEVQAMKAGMMEIADVFALNKADHPGTAKFEQELHVSLGDNPPPVVKTIATEGKGIEDVLQAARAAARIDPAKNARLWSLRLRDMLRERLLDSIPFTEFEEGGRAVAEHRSDPYTVLDGILRRVNL